MSEQETTRPDEADVEAHGPVADRAPVADATADAKPDEDRSGDDFELHGPVADRPVSD